MSDKPWLAVRTHDGRYSIWPEQLPVPPGWQPAGARGEKGDCLAWIAENWVDVRPAGTGRLPDA